MRILVIAIVAVTIMSPMGIVLYQSVLSAPFFMPRAEFSLYAFRYIFTDIAFYKALGMSFLVAGCMTPISVTIGTAFAFLVVRTDLPGGKWIEPFIMFPMFISSIILAFGYVVALGPVGVVSLAVRDLIGFVPWNIYSLQSLIIIAGLTHVPHVFIYAASAMRNLNSEAEEAARTAGGSPLRVALTISLPMVLPAILYSSVLLLFLGIELFGLPLILADPAGVMVLSTYLYDLLTFLGSPSYQLMAVVVVVLMSIAMPLVFIQRMLLRRADLYVSVKGKASQQERVKLGAWRWPALAIIVAWLICSVIIPIAALVMRSFVTTWGEGAVFLDSLTLQHYETLFRHPNLVRGVINTILMATVGGAVAVAAYTIISLAVHRWNSGWVRVLDYIALLPRAMPGIVAGLSIFWIFLFVAPLRPLRETLVSVWLAYTMVWLAYGIRMVGMSLMQIDPELEEAGRVAGASSARVRWTVTVPLVRAGLIGCWVLIFVLFAKEYSAGLFLLGAGSEVIGSMLVSLWGTGAVDLVTTLAVVNIAISGIGVALMLLVIKPSHR